MGRDNTKNRREMHQEEEGGSRSLKKRKTKSSMATNIAMDLVVLECTVCFDPLRPPIFQCTAEHVVCLSCRDKLPSKCELCSLTTGYSRCYAMEHVVECTTLPCSNAKYGCKERMAYYKKEDHEKACPHAPCFCPEDACCFVGSTGMLSSHFTTDHKLPCTSFVCDEQFSVDIEQGLNVLSGVDGHLFLFNMVKELFWCAIYVFCVQPHFTESKFACELLVILCHEHARHSQFCTFLIESTNLSDGLPSCCSMFIVPNCFEGDRGMIRVFAKISR